MRNILELSVLARPEFALASSQAVGTWLRCVSYLVRAGGDTIVGASGWTDADWRAAVGCSYDDVLAALPLVKVGLFDVYVIAGSKQSAKASRRAAPMTRPSLEEWMAYSEEVGFVRNDAQASYDHYESCGWRIGSGAGKPVKDWKACLRTCKNRRGPGRSTFGGDDKLRNTF